MKLSKIALVSSLFILVVSSTIGSIAAYDATSDTNTATENNQTSWNPSAKIDPLIAHLEKNPHRDLLAREFGTSYQGTKMTVYVNLNSSKIDLEGITPLARDGKTIVTRLSLDEMNQLASENYVNSITLPDLPVLYNTVSQGVNFTFANILQQKGITGKNVTVAILDDSFAVSDPAISANVAEAKLFDSIGGCGGSLLCGHTDGSSHGTAVAEIVVNMAPSVKLLLYPFFDSVDFSNAIDYAISKGNVDIITTSVGFPTLGGNGTTGFYRDGTSPVAQAVDRARNAGILVTVAAGNQGQTSWKGLYSISPVKPSDIGLDKIFNYQSLFDFQPQASGKQRACLPITSTGGEVITTWNAWPFTTQVYDLFLFDPTMTNMLASSTKSQSSTNLPPDEIIQAGGPTGNLCLVIASASSTQNHLFHIDVEGGSVAQPNQVRSGSIDTPADARGALAVGAVYYATDNLEVFSSSGPTDDGRAKPEICGPDGVSTNQVGLNPLNAGTFFGTSASTPHVAGAAALLKQEFPSLKGDQLRQKLISLARFNPSYSIDNLCGLGSGSVSLQNAIPPTNLRILESIQMTDSLAVQHTSSSQPPYVTTLLSVYNSRPDLKSAFPEAVNGNLANLFSWAALHGIHENSNLTKFASQYDIMVSYYLRPDLQSAFPEAANGNNIVHLIGWASHYGKHEMPSILGPHGAVYDMLSIYNTRPDLQLAFPEAANGNLANLFSWAAKYGINEDPAILSSPPDLAVIDLLSIYSSRPDLQSAFPQAANDGDIRSLLDWAHQFGESENAAILGTVSNKAVYDVMSIYDTRPDLQQAYPEAADAGDLHGLFSWAANFGIHESTTGTILAPDIGFYGANVNY